MKVAHYPKFRQSPKSPTAFSPAAIKALQRYHWPGNVRQFHSVVEQSVLFCDSKSIEPKDLPAAILTQKKGKGTSGSFRERVDALIAQMLRDVLAEFDGNSTAAARDLTITPNYLRKATRKFGARRT